MHKQWEIRYKKIPDEGWYFFVYYTKRSSYGASKKVEIMKIPSRLAVGNVTLFPPYWILKDIEDFQSVDRLYEFVDKCRKYDCWLDSK